MAVQKTRYRDGSERKTGHANTTQVTSLHSFLYVISFLDCALRLLGNNTMH